MSSIKDSKSDTSTIASDSTASISDSITMTLEKPCDICKQTLCKCDQFICPIHGKVKAKPNGKTKRTFAQKDPTKPNKLVDTEVQVDNFICSGEGCTIERTKNELEFPYTVCDKSE